MPSGIYTHIRPLFIFIILLAGYLIILQKKDWSIDSFFFDL